MYKTMGVYVFSVNPLPVTSSLTADNNDARKPPSYSYMCSLAVIGENSTTNRNINKKMNKY